jgi:TonB-linked SusC/RagA family outer membrane protein
LLLLVLGSLTLEAQSGKTVSGKITFSTGGEPVPGANITVQGSHAGTISDINGNYSIMVNEGDVLVISFVGYLNEHVVIGNTDTYNISLREDITQLDEVIKIGYGTMKRSDLTGAVVSISNEEIQRTVSTSFDQALQGRAAGVSVTQNSGQPGGSVSVRIRGINSLNANNEPLYVIDGVPIEGHSGNNSTNILSQISPADIVSMEVLKDASATAIYGSRAANGVILITTQRGKSGETRIGYDGFYAIQQLPYYIETMTLSEYAEYQNQRAELIGFGAREEFADPSVLGEGTNWQKEMFTNAPMQSHQVSLSGGDEQTTFSLSGGYLNQDGIAIGSNFERFTLRFTLDNQTRRWLKMGTSVYASRTKQRITVQDNNLIQQTLRQTPDVPLKNPDGSWGGPSENIYGTYSTNVVAEALMRENDKKGAQVIANLYAEIEFAKGLTFRSEFGGTVGYTTEYYYQPAFSFGFYENTINESRRSTGNSIYWLAKNYITYNKIFLTRHTLTVMAGQEAQENAWEGISGSRNNFLTNNVHELNAGDANTAKNSGHKGSSSLSSLFGRINYDYDDRYLLTATIRRDGSSKFGENNRFGLFPSFSLAWRLNNEAFFKNVSIVSNLKLRGGWGLVGNQNIPDYAYGAAMTSHTTIWGVGLLPSNMPNPDVQWESTAAINLGMDLSLFRNRIEFIADAYVKNTDNLLMQKPLPSYAGTAGQGAISSPWVNIGAIENKGLEFTLNTVNIDNRSFYWRSGLVFSTNRNRVTRLYTENSIVDKTVGTTIITRTIVDQPVGQFYGYDIIGMFEKEEDFYTTDESGNRVLVALPQDGQEIAPNGIWVGDFRFRDVNEDGVITEADRTFIGSPHPKFELGFNNNFSYMNLDLAFNITGVFGNKIYNWTRSEFESPMSNLGLFSSVSEYARIGVYDENLTGTDPGTGDELGAYQILSNVYITNPGTDIPRVTVYDANSNNRVSDRYIEDGSYIRLKNVIVGYTLPAKWVNKISIEQVRLYMNIQNLYTFSKYKGYDPEVGSLNQDMLLTGIDQYRYPSQRLFTFGVNVDF